MAPPPYGSQDTAHNTSGRQGSRAAFWGCLNKLTSKLEDDGDSPRHGRKAEGVKHGGKTVRFPAHSSLEQTLAQRISEQTRDPELYDKDKFLLEHVILSRSQRRRGRPARLVSAHEKATGIPYSQLGATTPRARTSHGTTRGNDNNENELGRVSEGALARLSKSYGEARPPNRSALQSTRFSQRSRTSVDSESIASGSTHTPAPPRSAMARSKSHESGQQLPAPPRTVRVRVMQDPGMREQRGVEDTKELITAEYPLRSDPAWRSRLKKRSQSAKTMSPTSGRQSVASSDMSVDRRGSDMASYLKERDRKRQANGRPRPLSEFASRQQRRAAQQHGGASPRQRRAVQTPRSSNGRGDDVDTTDQHHDDNTIPISHTTRLQQFSRNQQSRRRSHAPHKQGLLPNSSSKYSLSSRLRHDGHIPGPRPTLTEYEKLQLEADWSVSRRGEAIARSQKTKMVTADHFAQHVRFALFGKTAPREFEAGKRNARATSGLTPTGAVVADENPGTATAEFPSAITDLIHNNDALENHIPKPPPRRSAIRQREISDLEPGPVSPFDPLGGLG